ncbi:MULTISPECIES: o-succinylbenzoate synthase [Sanguibacteroides]|uniref:Chloromuconate cycloisomerase n=1 Tax=Sanguibacteroides justesenii TaxID=1547597 RepID=A0A0C3R4U1_9PORP|nr:MULTISPECIES: o-succinylbenzoate synthase [Sanguibacteroides]KIO44530.1 chloromuconate cycloisomerase [Sanguibacteroides justesenii]KIO45213.1 chloromuconate cycloisomerase [Sanguibacteroides justesenii]PXZ44503.1 o-succinylbenzoate synthase [Sanguibacteroides justesenii]
MLKASYIPYRLVFKQPAGTSRGILTTKESWFIKVWDTERPEVFGIGECALFRGLSADDRPDYEKQLEQVCLNIDRLPLETLNDWSSIRFGVETALADLGNGGKRWIYPTPFLENSRPIEINGLIWMGDRKTMEERLVEKLNAGFHCIKLKIGAIDFQSELELLKLIRSRFNRHDIELRVDANGAFTPDEALAKLEQLARYDIHSIEQPIRQGQWKEMARLCRLSPVPIALDEELIGISETERKRELLMTIQPRYIILKPALTGGFSGAEEWIEIAGRLRIGWWVTSALESNIGLNAIAQWTATLPTAMPQGLGTGQLYINNIPSPLEQKGCFISYNPTKKWELNPLSF